MASTVFSLKMVSVSDGHPIVDDRSVYPLQGLSIHLLRDLRAWAIFISHEVELEGDRVQLSSSLVVVSTYLLAAV